MSPTGKSGTVKTLKRTLALGRGHVGGFLVVALLVSLGTAASLFEPWIYRAIVDDIAGVFVAPQPVTQAGHALQELSKAVQHVPHSGRRMFRAPLHRVRPEEPQPRRLPPRTPNQAVATVMIGAVLLLVTRLLSEFCRFHGDNRSTTLASHIERGFILRTFRHVLRLPLDFFSRRASGAVARQIDQSDHVAPVFTAFAQEIWPDFFTLLAILAIMASLNRALALITFIAVPVYAFVTWQMTRRLETRLEEYYSLWDDVSSRIQQSVAGIKTVLTYGATQHEERGLDEETERAFSTYIARNRLQNRYAFAQEAIVTVSKAAALLLGGIKALQHQLTPGDVVLFLAYLDQVYAPIGSLTELYTSLQEHASSLKRAHRLLDEPQAPGEEKPPFSPNGGAIEFAEVRFGYRAQRQVLDGVSFRVRPGERVGLIGPSGAGKTTLTDLLVGLYQPQGGAILVDGQRLADVAPSSLRGAIRGVASDGMLFRLTIAENIRYGRFEATDPEVLEAARLAGLGPLLERLPEGLETVIGERGVELSVGERQRVLLARAFIARPAILLLDEATANLDFKTEEAVKQAIDVIARGRTTLVVAHRRSMLTQVDRVLVLRGGRIEQDGSPEELMREDGYFRQMMTAHDGGGNGHGEAHAAERGTGP
jgi:ABC-type multidrug transport system fused ATPase/permease subunit